MDSQRLIEGAILLIPLVLSLTVHEFAHAWSAWLLGDDTAQREGRMTLDPMPHIDPIGTLLLPFMSIAFSSPIPLGWARPVPINPARFRRGVDMSTGMMITALAGPFSNVLLALLSAAAYGMTLRWAPDTLAANPGLKTFLLSVAGMNVALALFNLLPIPPLDGSRVVERFVPYSMRDTWERVVQLSPFLLLAFLYFGRGLLVGPIGYFTGLLDGLIFSIWLG